MYRVKFSPSTRQVVYTLGGRLIKVQLNENFELESVDKSLTEQEALGTCTDWEPRGIFQWQDLKPSNK